MARASRTLRLLVYSACPSLYEHALYYHVENHTEAPLLQLAVQFTVKERLVALSWAFTIACEKSHFQQAQSLADRLADGVQANHLTHARFETTCKGVFLFACTKGHAQIIKMLFAMELAEKAWDAPTLLSGYRRACERNRHAVAMCIIEQASHTQILQNYRATTEFEMACKYGFQEIVAICLTWTPPDATWMQRGIEMACAMNHACLVSALLHENHQRTAPLKAQLHRAIELACENDHVGVVRHLMLDDDSFVKTVWCIREFGGPRICGYYRLRERLYSHIEIG